MTAHIVTPGIHVRITCEVRASLAGISALPKAHLAHVLLPCCKDMKILNNIMFERKMIYLCLAHMSENDG